MLFALFQVIRQAHCKWLEIAGILIEIASCQELPNISLLTQVNALIKLYQSVTPCYRISKFLKSNVFSASLYIFKINSTWRSSAKIIANFVVRSLKQADCGIDNNYFHFCSSTGDLSL